MLRVKFQIDWPLCIILHEGTCKLTQVNDIVHLNLCTPEIVKGSNTRLKLQFAALKHDLYVINYKIIISIRVKL